MRKYGFGCLVWLSLILLAGLSLHVPEARAQRGFFSDFTFGFWGETREESRMGREDVIAREGACPTGGCILKLTAVEVRPLRARPGDTLTLTTVYTILTPEQAALPVSITREIFFQGQALGRTKSIDSRVLNGTWTQDLDFTLPADARPGLYTLRTTVSTGYGSEQKEVKFEVY